LILATKADALICPACGQRAMTESQKFRLGPLLSRACASCATRLSISWADFFHVNWPIFIALLVGMPSRKLGGLLIEIVDKHLDLHPAVTMTLMIVFCLIVPIGIFMTFLAWGAIRVLDRAPRIGLVVRGEPRADSKTPIPPG
jgi:hypothetical protein